MSVCKLCIAIFGMALLSACSGGPGRGDPVQPRQFGISVLAKTDVDMVVEVSVRHSLDYLRELARKLYVRNPAQLRNSGYASRSDVLDALFVAGRGHFDRDLRGRRSSEAIALAFDEQYHGDRVAAFVVGMRTMLLDAYGGKTRFFVLDRLDPQKLYYLARNFEIAFWKLGHDAHHDGDLYLLSNALEGSGDLSFERLAGKLIGVQDHIAQVVADSSNRQIKNVVHSVASAVFFPI